MLWKESKQGSESQERGEGRGKVGRSETQLADCTPEARKAWLREKSNKGVIICWGTT